MMKGIGLLVVLVLLVVAVVGLYFLFPSEREGEDFVCAHKECPDGYILYGFYQDCGLSVDGLALCPVEISSTWDCECHEICGHEGVGCSNEVQSCKEATVQDMALFLCF